LKIILLPFHTLLEIMNVSAWVTAQQQQARCFFFFFLNYAPSKTVQLSNCYADDGKLDMSLKPKKGYSWIEFWNKIHVWDWRCIPPKSENIYNLDFGIWVIKLLRSEFQLIFWVQSWQKKKLPSLWQIRWKWIGIPVSICMKSCESI
jgi:hypothetical protein